MNFANDLQEKSLPHSEFRNVRGISLTRVVLAYSLAGSTATAVLLGMAFMLVSHSRGVIALTT